MPTVALLVSVLLLVDVTRPVSVPWGVGIIWLVSVLLLVGVTRLVSFSWGVGSIWLVRAVERVCGGCIVTGQGLVRRPRLIICTALIAIPPLNTITWLMSVVRWVIRGCLVALGPLIAARLSITGRLVASSLL